MQTTNHLTNIMTLLSLCIVFDYTTYHFITGLLSIITSTLIWLGQLSVTRFLFNVFLGIRIGLFVWYRYKVHRHLADKCANVAEGHRRLTETLRHAPDTMEDMGQPCDMSITELHDRLTSDRLTPSNLLEAHQALALSFTICMPGVIAELVSNADVRAILAEMMLSSGTNAPGNYLVGIPIAVQEAFPLTGYDHCMGLVGRTNKPAQTDCTLVSVLEDLGAVPFAMTNSQQQLASLQSSNVVFGEIGHPSHPDRSCLNAGPLLVSMRICRLAFILDILGEGRLSASYCGTPCFKATNDRMTCLGMDLPINALSCVGATPTIVGHSIIDIVLALRSLWTPVLFDRDVNVTPNQFNVDLYEEVRSSRRQLRIGYFTELPDLLQSSVASERVVMEAVSHLANIGHKLVPFTFPSPVDSMQLAHELLESTLQPDTLNRVYFESTGDSLVNTCYQRTLHAFYALPTPIKSFLVARLVGSDALTDVSYRAMVGSRRLDELLAAAANQRQQFFARLTDEPDGPIDCLLCPASPLPAPDLKRSSITSTPYLTRLAYGFVDLVTPLNCPVGVAAFGQVTRADIEAQDRVADEGVSRRRTVFAEQVQRGEMLPVGVQVIGHPGQDEVVLGLLDCLAAK